MPLPIDGHPTKTRNKAQTDRILASLDTYKTVFKEVVSVKDAQEIAESKMLKAAGNTQKASDEVRISQRSQMMSQITSAKTMMIAGTHAAIIIGIFLSIIIIRGITRAIQSVIEGLKYSSDQVASASGQISASSLSLAEGASEQAASIEETSASLEEMSSMTRQNAQNANQANDLVKNANRTVGEANGSMNELIGSMEDISNAGKETQKIVKTIDEIAFQTNLLALNAAVEAARAGETGAGFAVVADEVRNLAMKAAEAARNTAQLIDGTVKKVSYGSDLASVTNGAFSDVATSVGKVGELVSEISAASDEQAAGIDQVNRAVSETDRVTQQNAANAEESASASEEMSGQAEQMKGYVNRLISLVQGNKNINGQILQTAREINPEPESE
jgi:methyl-accepting chemotaxis protein